jgi:hypothetical protein
MDQHRRAPGLGRGCHALARGIAGACLAVLTLAGPGAHACEGLDEYQVKAAFLGKFVKYVTWPPARLADRRAPFVVGVLGKDPFGDKLVETFRDKQVEERRVEIRQFSALEGVSEAHLLFVTRDESDRLEAILATTRGAGVLLVGESGGFAADGGSINFYLEDKRLRFEVNPEAARRQGLKVSSELLKVARIVEDRG